MITDVAAAKLVRACIVGLMRNWNNQMTDRATIAAQQLASNADLRASVVDGIADFFRASSSSAPGTTHGGNVVVAPEHLNKHALRNRDSESPSGRLTT